MRLAWHNLSHERTRFLVTVLGIACATLLMFIQGGILIGFLGAASKIIDTTDADIWMAGRGAPCFEFPVSLEKRLVELAHSVPGVGETSRICTRIVPFRKPDGDQQLVTLIGADSGVGKRFPIPFVSRNGTAIEPHALLIDESNRRLLNASGQWPLAVEVNKRRANVVGETSGFSSFLGTPYVFTSYADGARYTVLDPEETMYILVRLQAQARIGEVVRGLKNRFPSVDIWTREEFSRKSQVYWISQTGAGGAILTAALLGFFIGLAVVSQAVYATTMEHIEEFATLKALGASHLFVVRTIVAQALACGAAGYLLGVAVSAPLVHQVRSAIPWIVTPTWLPAAILPLALAICIIASILSVRAALAVEPARVFRA
jgi:putative ABC transport system permease protein